MECKTFKKGVRVPHNKRTEDSALKECPAPDKVYIPLSQHIGKPALPCVNAGDTVKAGTLVGKADGFVSADVFSSVSGKVTGFERRRTPTGSCDFVVIENDGNYEEELLPPVGVDADPERLKLRMKEAGLVGMGGAGFPSAVKYSPKTAVDAFIVNAAECEPYITCDYRILTECTKEFLRGAEMLAKILGVRSFYIGIEDNKPKAIAALNDLKSVIKTPYTVTPLKSKYPQGAEKQLIYAVTGRKVPPGKLPADVGAVVGNVHTAYSMFAAAVNGRPLYRRALTVCGGGIKNAENLWVRTGTPYSELEKFCGGHTDDCVKIIAGGPMMGFALESTEGYIVGKTTGAILFLNRKEANTLSPEPCINCGKCAKACPMNLMPMYIDAYTLRGDYETAAKYGATNCIECGCCAYTCPSKRQIVQSIKLCKKKLREIKR